MKHAYPAFHIFSTNLSKIIAARRIVRLSNSILAKNQKISTCLITLHQKGVLEEIEQLRQEVIDLHYQIYITPIFPHKTD